MPIYEYRCDACGFELEALQKIADAPLTDCPDCSEKSLVKKVSAAAFRLKGGGWYETDFKSGNQKNLASSDSKSSESKSSDASGTKKADSSGSSSKSSDSGPSGKSSSKAKAS